MNNLLELRGKFSSGKNTNHPGNKNIKKNETFFVEKIDTTIEELKKTKEYWNHENIIKGALVSVLYKTIIPKSSRLSKVLRPKGKDLNNCVVGVKYSEDGTKHIITYYITKETIQDSINSLELLKKILTRLFGNNVTFSNIEDINNGIIQYDEKMSKTELVGEIVDLSHIEKIYVQSSDKKLENNGDIIINTYKVDDSLNDILQKLGINVPQSNIFEDTLVKLKYSEYELLDENMPYFIAMKSNDKTLFDISNYSIPVDTTATIQDPTNEPIIGVIDTPFDDSVYFSKWVDYRNCIDETISSLLSKEASIHGTEISSIIVDGARNNKKLDDGCGFFRVRHFGVCPGESVSLYILVKKIIKIVKENTDIKVWNISLGTKDEIQKNFVSYIACVLDQLQFDNEIIFIVAGTNDNSHSMKEMIGSPADSINSLVVNSVDSDNNPTNYSRSGPALSFFQKPDISYYGGDLKDPILVCTGLGAANASGTSFAAPWIARKMCYLIEKIGLSREVAKALIIDSAAGWSPFDLDKCKYKGYGVVPIKINDILKCKDDEIRFFINGTAEDYFTYLYNLPIPRTSEGYPYVAKLTMVYFPYCIRNQGVDYTASELNINFGRVKDDDNIVSINNNTQDINGTFTKEEAARKYFRKWDNVKHLYERNSLKPRPRRYYQDKMWGINVTAKERIATNKTKGIRFGIVITLREINGFNRITDFIKQCQLKGWIVNTVNVESSLKLYNKIQEELDIK